MVLAVCFKVELETDIAMCHECENSKIFTEQILRQTRYKVLGLHALKQQPTRLK